MREYLDELMAGEMDEEDKNPPPYRPQNQQGVTVGKGTGADGFGAVSANVAPTTARGIAPTAEEQAAQQAAQITPVNTRQALVETTPADARVPQASQTNTTPSVPFIAGREYDSDPNAVTPTDYELPDGMTAEDAAKWGIKQGEIPQATIMSSAHDANPLANTTTDLEPAFGEPKPPAPAPAVDAQGNPPAPAPAVDAQGNPVAPATGQQQPAAPKLVQLGGPTSFYNQSGQFYSGDQTQAAIENLKKLDLNPNVATLNKAILGVQRYETGGQQPMPLEPDGVFVKGWEADDYNSLVDWEKIDGIGRKIDVSKPADRELVESWLASRFGAGLKGMHIDKHFGPYHVAAILEASGQTPGDPNQPNQPTKPKRPDDPTEPNPDPYKDRYEEYLRKGYNPLMAMMGPEPKAIDTSRLRAIMGAQALGEGLRSIADVIHGPKGAPITEHKNNVTDWSIGKIDEAVKQFGSDKKEYRKMKLDALMHAMNDARVQSNMDRQDWRLGVQQMYDRFDKKVDRKDKQYQQELDRYDKDRIFKQSVDQFAATLQQQGLNRAQAKELAIMQLNHAEKMQANQIAAQKQLQEEAIKAGRYQNNGNGGGKNSTVTVRYEKVGANGNTEIVNENLDVPANVADEVNKKLVKDMIADKQFKREVDKFTEGLKATGKTNAEINRLLLQEYIGRYNTYQDGQWVPIGVGAAGGAPQPATGQNGPPLIKTEDIEN